MNKTAQFEAALKQNGERLSSPRLAIFTALSRKGPISIPALVSLMHKSAINPATTYRNLKLFRKLNIVRDIGTGSKRMVELSDEYDAHHHHFWCRKCDTMMDFDSQEVEQSLAHIAAKLGVQITSHHLELSGICGACYRKSEINQ